MVEKYVSNIIRMRNWIDCSNFLTLFLSLFILLLCLSFQSRSQTLNSQLQYSQAHFSVSYNPFQSPLDTTQADPSPNLPDPKSVLYKSMIVPGWGQVVNKQAWKIPIIYGILGGLGYYSVHLTKKYHDYRAAYYNLNPEIPNDFRFGQTPSYISENANLQELRSLRNQSRNRRDLVYVGIVVAYGLNIVDAYVFAHMRSFDVSEDLSMRTRIQPSVLAHTAPGVTLSIDLISRK